MKRTIFFKLMAIAMLLSMPADYAVTKNRQPMQEACTSDNAVEKGCCPRTRFDGEISWNPDEMHYNIKQQTGPIVPALFQPYLSNGYFDVVSGWVMQPTTNTDFPPFAVTMEFQVPHDIDPSVTPIIVLHWFNQSQNLPDSEFTCTGNYLNWQVTSDYFPNLAQVNGPTATPKYILKTGDVLLTFPVSSNAQVLVQQQIAVPLTGQPLVPGSYAQITVKRIATTAHAETTCPVYLSVVAFQYRKRAQ
jgi:hypothetical protein